VHVEFDLILTAWLELVTYQAGLIVFTVFYVLCIGLAISPLL